MARRRRRSNTAVIDFLRDLTDDIKDFLDDEVWDRTRDTERDLRRAGRNVTDDERDSRVDDLRDAIVALNKQIEAIETEPPARPAPAAAKPAATKPAAAKPAPAKAKTAAATKTAPGRPTAKANAEPWAGYDDLTVAEVRKALPGSSDTLLEKVRVYELAHKNRKGVLDAADAEIGS